MTAAADKINSPIPDFSLTGTKGIAKKISDYQANLVLFFYPKDNTPICTSEAKSFRDHLDQFESLNTVILGVSRDSVASHERFKERLALPFELISDSSEELCNYFDVISQKNFFGKKIRGIVRSTFLIDENLILRRAWRKIKVTGHIDEIVRTIKDDLFK